MDILIVVEDNNGKIHRMGLESISAAQSISKDKGFSIGVLVMGGNAEGLATELSKYDVSEVLKLNNDIISSYSSDGYAEAVKQVIEQENPKYVFFGHTYQVRDYVPKISAKLMKPFLVDNVSINKDGAFTISFIVMEGKFPPYATSLPFCNSLGPVEPAQPPSTFEQITKNLFVSIGLLGPTILDHQPSLPVMGLFPATY